VVFSAPTGGETDVSPSTNIRIQFSRDIDPATFKGRLIVRYADAPAAADAAPPAATPEFSTQYLPGTRVLEITFTEPLRPLRPIEIVLQDGILGTDKQPLVPWTLKFETGS
jgi:hypothetical protein